MYISKAMKITMDKASKVAKDTFKNPEKMGILKKKLSKMVNSQDFKDLKIIFETGAAVGGVIMVLEYYYNPPALLVFTYNLFIYIIYSLSLFYYD